MCEPVAALASLSGTQFRCSCNDRANHQLLCAYGHFLELKGSRHRFFFVVNWPHFGCSQRLARKVAERRVIYTVSIIQNISGALSLSSLFTSQTVDSEVYPLFHFFFCLRQRREKSSLSEVSISLFLYDARG